MMVRRRRKEKRERLVRAKPPKILTLRRKPEKIVEKSIINKHIKQFLHEVWNTGSNKKIKKVMPEIILKEISPSCQAKKAKARHNYFSMRSSGKGAAAKHMHPTRNRFDSRC